MKSKQTKELHIVSLSSRMFCLRINEGARIFCNNLKKVSRLFPWKWVKLMSLRQLTSAFSCQCLSAAHKRAVITDNGLCYEPLHLKRNDNNDVFKLIRDFCYKYKNTRPHVAWSTAMMPLLSLGKFQNCSWERSTSQLHYRLCVAQSWQGCKTHSS